MPLLDQLSQDLRFAIRQFGKQPAFTITAVFILALGLCSSIAIFAFVDAALLKPLPYRQPAGLVGVYERIPLCEQCNLSYPDYRDWKGMNKTLVSLDVYTGAGFSIASPCRCGAGSGRSRLRWVLSNVGRRTVAGARLPGRRGSTLRGASRDPELCFLAKPLWGKAGNHRPKRDI